MHTQVNRFKHLPRWFWEIENKEKFRGSSYWHNTAAQQARRAPCAQTLHNSGYTQLRGMHALVEDLENDTWVPGFAIQDFLTEGWPDGRAGFVLKALEGMEIEKSIAVLPTDVQAWVKGYAA